MVNQLGLRVHLSACLAFNQSLLSYCQLREEIKGTRLKGFIFDWIGDVDHKSDCLLRV